ncbi:MAG: BatD family protein [Candidatus Krumholzibacteriia bacterium]
MSRALATLALALVLAPLAAAAADVTCSAEVDRRVVAPGGQVVLTLHAQGDLGQQPGHQPPQIDGVEVVPGGTSQRFQLVNGRSEFSVDVTYYLVVDRDSDFQIPSIVFSGGGQTCRTDPISITVKAGAPPPAPSAGEPADSGARAGRPGDAYFITLAVDRDEVWVGQQVVLTFRYYHSKSPWNQPSYTAPRTEGFWRVDLPPERNFPSTLAGNRYDVTELRYALFPTRAGSLTVEPARLEIAGDPFDRIFGRRSRGPVILATDPITIEVKDLPTPRPPAFSGIVADRLAFTATVDRDTVPRGEPVSLHLEVTADGFLKSFEGVRLPEQPGVRLHDAAENLRENVNGPRYEATFSEEKAAVPVTEGTLEFGPLDLVYFDTGQGRYRSVRATVPSVVVTPSDLPVLGDDRSGFRRTEIARLGNDLAFIHQRGGSSDGPILLPLGHPAWWLLLVAPWLALGGLRLWLRRREADRRDPVGLRRRRSLEVARRRLAEAEAASDPDVLARAILGFVADRQGRSAAGLTAADLVAWAGSQGQPAVGERLAAVLVECDQARFGGSADHDITALAGEVRGLLQAVSGGRPGPGSHTVALLGTLALVGVLGVGVGVAGDPAGAPGPDPARLIAEGNQAYTEGDLDLAVRRYTEARELGADSADLHYNLGNAHARAGELGKAIASYLRAERYAPRDRDLQRNLAWVRQNTRDLELAAHGLPPVVAQLDQVAHLLAVREWGLVLLVLSWLVCILLAWTWWTGDLGAGRRRLLIAVVTLALAVAVVSATRWYEEHWRRTAVVVVDEAEVRSGPATTFPVVFRVHDGLTLEVRGERDGWNRVGLGGDWGGWVPAGTLEEVDQGR